MPSLTTISSAIAFFALGTAAHVLASGPSNPPTVAEMFDQAYCQGWERAAANLTERAAVIRAVFKAEEQWEMAREAMDIGQCPRSKPRVIGQEHPQ